MINPFTSFLSYQWGPPATGPPNEGQNQGPDEIKFIFKGRRKCKHERCPFGPLPSLPNVQCASALHINQSLSKMGVPTGPERVFSPLF